MSCKGKIARRELHVLKYSHGKLFSNRIDRLWVEQLTTDQEFCQIGAILTGNAGDQCCLGYVFNALEVNSILTSIADIRLDD